MSTTLDAGQTYIDIILPTFHTEPAELDRFYPSAAKEIADAILTEELSSQTYDEEEAKGWANSICDRVREAVKDKLCATRYKVVVQTTIGQLKDQAIRVASRCLWDPTVDNYASTSFKNETIFASVMIFAIYTD